MYARHTWAWTTPCKSRARGIRIELLISAWNESLWGRSGESVGGSVPPPVNLVLEHLFSPSLVRRTVPIVAYNYLPLMSRGCVRFARMALTLIQSGGGVAKMHWAALATWSGGGQAWPSTRSGSRAS